MDIRTRHYRRAIVVQPIGSINMQTSPELRQTILDEFSDGDGRCIVNLAEVNYIDSSGLATLIEGLQLSQAGGGEFVLCGIVEPMIQELLEITRLTSTFSIFETEEEALEVA